MIEIGNTLVSDDLKESNFVCDLKKCKGACCVEGDLGAPVDQDEIAVLEEVLDEVLPYLTEDGRKALEQQGVVVNDYTGDFSTPLINDKECAYINFDTEGIAYCGIEKAFLDGKITYRKPISCYLYPVRLTELNEVIAVNYDMWKICTDACVLGEELKVPLYKFLKDPLITKFGQEWYNELVEKIENEQ